MAPVEKETYLATRADIADIEDVYIQQNAALSLFPKPQLLVKVHGTKLGCLQQVSISSIDNRAAGGKRLLSTGFLLAPHSWLDGIQAAQATAQAGLLYTAAGTAGCVEFKPVAELRSGAVLFTCVEPLKRATEETLQEMPDAALALLSAWCFVSKTMARHSLSLACFNQHAVFFAPGSKKVVILPCGPLVVLDKPYSNTSAELSAVDAFGEFVHFNEFIKANRLKAALQANYPTVLAGSVGEFLQEIDHVLQLMLLPGTDGPMQAWHTFGAAAAAAIRYAPRLKAEHANAIKDLEAACARKLREAVDCANSKFKQPSSSGDGSSSSDQSSPAVLPDTRREGGSSQTPSSNRYHPYHVDHASRLSPSGGSEGARSSPGSSNGRHNNRSSNTLDNIGHASSNNSSPVLTVPIPDTADVPDAELVVNWPGPLLMLVPEAAKCMECIAQPNCSAYGWFMLLRNKGQHRRDLEGPAARKILVLLGRTGFECELSHQDLDEFISFVYGKGLQKELAFIIAMTARGLTRTRFISEVIQDWGNSFKTWIGLALNPLSHPVLQPGASAVASLAPDDSGIGSWGAAAGVSNDGSEAHSPAMAAAAAAAAAGSGVLGWRDGHVQAVSNPLTTGLLPIMFEYLKAADVPGTDIVALQLIEEDELKGVNSGCGIVVGRVVLLGLLQAANLACKQQHNIKHLSDILRSLQGVAARTAATSLASSFERTLCKLQDLQCPATLVVLEANILLWKIRAELLGNTNYTGDTVGKIQQLLKELPAAAVPQLPKGLQRSLERRKSHTQQQHDKIGTV